MVCFNWPTEDGLVTKKNIEHYRAFAKGGAGLIIVEATAITKDSKIAPNMLGIWSDEHIEGLRKITDAIHENGAKTFIQLVHAGGYGWNPDAEAPSAREYRWHGAKEMTKERIKETIHDFVLAAERAKKAGFDGVEIHGCHSYLVSCFFNKNYNMRTDEYGKDRSLFAREVLLAVKKACGPDFIVGIRFGIFEPEMEDGLENVKGIIDCTDFLDVSYGADARGFAPEGFPCSEAVYGASILKKNYPDMPVFSVHNINSKEDVINALNTGIDMADIGKASLVDPAFANHVINDEPYGQCLHCKNYCRWNPMEMANPDLKCPGFEKFNRK